MITYLEYDRLDYQGTSMDLFGGDDCAQERAVVTRFPNPNPYWGFRYRRHLYWLLVVQEALGCGRVE